METNGFDRSVQDPRPPQPHFDDELTVLTARPVVPLQTINAQVKNRRYWLLAGALTIAMMLGAGSALLASYLRLRNVRAAAQEVVPQEEIAPAPSAVAESVPSASPEEGSVEEPAPVTAEEPKKAARPAKSKTIVRTAPEVEAPRSDSKIDEGDDLNRIREAVLYDQWQERRARRVARERRRADRYNHRDLSDLDEIFEGRKKP